MKLSAYPMGTVIEIVGYGAYKKHRDWCMVGNDEVFELKDYVDQLQADGVPINIISVPWGVTEQLIERVLEFQIDAFGVFGGDDRDQQDKEDIFEDAVEKYKHAKTAKWLAESEEVRAKMRERIDKLRKKLGGDSS